MSRKKGPFEVRNGPRGKIDLGIRAHGNYMSVTLTAEETSDLVTQLLKSSVAGFLVTHDVGAPGFQWPMASANDIYAPFAWPLTVALASPASDETHAAVGLAAAFGDAQVVVGLQRNQLRRLGEILLEMDKRLPPSDHFELGLGSP